MAEYQKAIDQAPSMPRLHFDLGFLHWEQGHYAEAGNEFAKELEVNPGFAPALYYQGDIALNAEKPREALALFRAASDRDPACLEPWLGQGKALVRLNRPAEALGCFEKAAKIDAGQAGRLLLDGHCISTPPAFYREPTGDGAIQNPLG